MSSCGFVSLPSLEHANLAESQFIAPLMADFDLGDRGKILGPNLKRISFCIIFSLITTSEIVDFILKTNMYYKKQMSVNETSSAVTVEWMEVELRRQKELGRFTFQVGMKQQNTNVHPVS